MREVRCEPVSFRGVVRRRCCAVGPVHAGCFVKRLATDRRSTPVSASPLRSQWGGRGGQSARTASRAGDLQYGMADVFAGGENAPEHNPAALHAARPLAPIPGWCENVIKGQPGEINVASVCSEGTHRRGIAFTHHSNVASFRVSSNNLSKALT